MTTSTPRALVVDDEPVARRRLTRLIEASGMVTLVGEAQDGVSALAAIDDLKPEIVFLDVEMPELSGVDVAKRLEEPRPMLVFVTAHNRFAVEAFALDAVDYLLKPYDEVRVEAMLARVLRRLGASQLEKSCPVRDRLVALQRGEVRLIPVSSIETVEAADNYVEVTLTGGATYLVRETIESLTAELPAPFVRISRKVILRSDRIVAARSVGHGDMDLEMGDGRVLRLSRRFRQGLGEAQPDLLRR